MEKRAKVLDQITASFSELYMSLGSYKFHLFGCFCPICSVITSSHKTPCNSLCRQLMTNISLPQSVNERPCGPMPPTCAHVCAWGAPSINRSWMPWVKVF